MWNIKGLNGKINYLRILLADTKPDLVIITETKMKRPIINHTDIGDTEYNDIQLKSTE